VWGQFIERDIDFTDGADPAEPADIPVPTADPYFDPRGTGDRVIPLNRSIYDTSTGTDSGNHRQQLSEVTSWPYDSTVYGSDEKRAHALRRYDGSDKLRTSAGNLLPLITEGLPNAGGPSDTPFLAGDVRANEQVGLTSMHTLFVREQNRIADELAKRHPRWDGEHIYQATRRMVGAEIQVITYKEFLPVLLGKNALSHYHGYKPRVDASIRNEFTTAAYRFGHSALSPVILRLDSHENVIPEGNMPLRDAYFAPYRITDEGGIAQY
jgi:peroxidase